MSNSRAAQGSHPPIQHDKWKKFPSRRFSLSHPKDPENLIKSVKKGKEKKEKKKRGRRSLRSLKNIPKLTPKNNTQEKKEDQKGITKSVRNSHFRKPASLPLAHVLAPVLIVLVLLGVPALAAVEGRLPCACVGHGAGGGV